MMVSSPTAHASGTAVPGIRKVSWRSREGLGWGFLVTVVVVVVVVVIVVVTL